MISSRFEKSKKDKSIIISIYLSSIILLILFMLINNQHLLGLLLLLSTSIAIIFATHKVHFLFFLILFVLINNQFFEIIFKINSIVIPLKFIVYIYILFAITIMIFEKKFQKFSKEMLIPVRYYIIFILFLIGESILNNTNKSSLIILILFFVCTGIYTQILVLSHSKYRKLFICTIVTSILSLILLGFTELLIGKTFFLSQWTGEERFRNGILRIGSTVGDPNFVCLIILSFYPFLDTQAFKKIFNRMFIKIIKILMIFIILITGSRTGLIVIIINFFLKIIYKNKKFFIIGILSLIIIYFTGENFLSFLYDMDKSSNYAREMINQLSFNIIQQNPIFGIGLGNFNLYSKSVTTSNITNALSTMNTYYYILTSLGLVGFVFYSIYLYRILKESIYNIFNDYDSFCIFMSVVSWSIMITTLDSLYIVYLWILPGIIICVKKQNNEKGCV